MFYELQSRLGKPFYEFLKLIAKSMTTFRRGRRPGSRERPNTATLAHPSILDETLKVSITSIKVLTKIPYFLSQLEKCSKILFLWEDLFLLRFKSKCRFFDSFPQN